MDSSEGSARLPGAQPAALVPVNPLSTPDPLFNLWVLRQRMDSLHDFLSQSIESKSQLNDDEVCFVSTEITSAIHDIFSNGAALVASSLQQPSLPPGSDRIVEETVGFGLENVSTPVARRNPGESSKLENQMLPATSMRNSRAGVTDPVSGDVSEIIELDAVELLAEHVHFCDICGKGFKRDANRRMHMRAHGEQFKTLEALAKPGKSRTSRSVIITKTLFSCPFPGCNRNRAHKKFRPLKSAICAKTHFKRSHCPKLYLCDRCNKKSFSVLADLKSHLKHCGKCRWKCSCGTSFLRKDKLFGHLALFQGHMPAVMEEEKSKELVAAEEFHTDIEEDAEDEDFIEGLLDSIDGSPIDDLLG